MTDLRCEAVNCVYNEKCLCHRQEINVGNSKACTKAETCCESYSNDDSAKNACVSKKPEGKLVIKCEAVKCVYNDNNYCSAECVDIGNMSAETSKETKCETFRMK